MQERISVTRRDLLCHVPRSNRRGIAEGHPYRRDIKRRRIPYVVLNRCVCAFSSHSFWTSSSLDVPAGVTQEEGHTGFFIRLLSAVRALIFLARMIQPFLSLVECEVKFCVTNDLIVLHPLGIFSFVF